MKRVVAAKTRIKPTKDASLLTIEPLAMTEVSLCILGASPLIFHRMSVKAQRELLLPAGPKNRASLRASLKHDPIAEYRDSVYTDSRPESPTLLVFPSTGFKGAALAAALEVPGASKASIGRLLQVIGYQLRIWGVPKIYMTGVRTQGMNHTPDIRTRAILPEWATVLTVRFPQDSLTASSVANLFAAAGQLSGIGDFRQERGKGSFGLFSIVNKNDPDFERVTAEGGRIEQAAALENPEPFDDETATLWQWFEEEIVARGRGRAEVTSHADA